MRTLVIYDTKGTIISNVGGAIKEPEGIPFIWVDVPTNTYVEKIDVSKEKHEAVLKEYQQTEVQRLQEEILSTQLALTELYERMEG